MPDEIQVGFEWDRHKREANLAKHGIDFADAIRIFDGIITGKTFLHVASNEERLRATGIVNGREITVIYTMRKARKRIISARRASKYERQEYYYKVTHD